VVYKSFEIIKYIYRNAGPVANFKDKYEAFRKRIISKQLKTYNTFDGKADVNGKEYLIELTNAHFPIILTIDSLDSLSKKVNSKSKETLIQPFIDFEYEVSFYYIDKEFQYALYAPDKDKRWELKNYVPKEVDLAFANRFIEWNNIDWGIQRVDACRTKQGELLLVELEDLNPYLSLLELDENTRQSLLNL
jgi:hypothetical protein